LSAGVLAAWSLICVATSAAGAEFPRQFELSALDGGNGFTLHGIDAWDNLGSSVAGAGDINGDGIDDVVVGASGAEPNGKFAIGETYVIFGSDQGFPAALDLSSLDGKVGFTIEGINDGDQTGGSVAGAGDINGDGLDDLIIGAQWANPEGRLNDGQAYVVFGSNAGFPRTLRLSTLDGSNGFTLNGTGLSGYSVARAGDFNGDGIGDIIIGAPGAEQAHVVFGSGQGFPAVVELSALNGDNGVALNGSFVFSATSVAGAGDVNGDRIDDVIVGASGLLPTESPSQVRATLCSARTGGSPPRWTCRHSMAATASSSTASTRATNRAIVWPAPGTSTVMESTTL